MQTQYEQQSSLQNNGKIVQNSMQQQIQSYTYPYSTMYSNNMTGMNTNIPSSYASADYNLYLNSIMQPLSPPPDKPCPY
ncbi:unnamed protein product [Rotaria sp. Silwood2]|nr:unnamed protein product [Rotaria sp. Silwood2]CAF2711904.1 unnamed protein product [Rotaria sp. Silwood2]CAF2953965.1 unnamed protein product [Rotaria sp. Silwood2]CAF3116638.1 unnamed protein product [Rotaria sp. Silwood2]CAF3999775.1 unnamed protein product [Rotaria sp. Silwood2]